MRTCPVCGSNDTLINVPGVVAQGTQRTQGTGVSHGHGFDWAGYQFTRTRHAHRFTSLTDLAADLSFPRVPEPPAYWKLGIVMFFASSAGAAYDGVGTAVFSTVVIGVPFLLSLFFAGMVLTGHWASWGRATLASVAALATFVTGANLLMRAISDGLRPPDALMTTVMALLMLLGIGVMILGWRERRAYRRAVAHQQRAYQLWQGLYYCSRDNVVLDPESGRFGPPGAVRKLVYPR